MKTCCRICGVIAFVCWTFLCIAAATGYWTIDVYDYCVASGVLALYSLFIIIRGY